MKKFKIGLTIHAQTAEKGKKIATLLQQAANKIDNEDMIKLLQKAVDNPGIIKTALMFT